MNQVFVSYSRDDSGWVDAFTASLTGMGIPVWIDRRDIPAVMSWLADISDAIEECAFIVVCNSPSWLESVSCQAEESLAKQLGKEAVHVSVRSHPTAEADRVAGSFRQLPMTTLMHNELRVRARGWDRSGRSKRMLVGARIRRRLQTGVHDSQESATERAFLQSSRRRSRRRALVAGIATTLVLVGTVSGEAFGQAGASLEKTNAGVVKAFQESNAAAQLTETDPYAGLGAVAASAVNSGGVLADELSNALADPVPDEAFSVPGGAKRFASSPVNAQLEVVTGTGQVWQQPVRDSSPTPPNYAGLLESVAADNWSATAKADTGVVTISENGRLYRRVVVGDHPAVLEFSPDGRWLAAALGTEVDLIDVQRGSVRQTFRGAPGPVSALDWSRLGDRLWAIAAGRVVAWTARTGTVLVDQPGDWYQGIFPARRPESAWVIERDGLVAEINVLTGADERQVGVNETVYSADIDPTLQELFVVGSSGESLLSLDTGVDRALRITSCTAGRGAFSTTGASLFVPCSGGEVVELAVATGSTVRRLSVPGGAESVAVDPENGALLVGGWTGGLYEFESSLIPVTLDSNICDPLVNDVAVSPTGHAILAVGEPTGTVDCTHIGVDSGIGSFSWNAVIDTVPSSVGSDVALFDRSGGEFFIGYDDGTVDAHPTKSLLPELANTTVVGEVRGLVIVQNRLLIATSAGLIQSVPLCRSCLSNRYLADEAAGELRRSVRLQLTKVPATETKEGR